MNNSLSLPESTDVVLIGAGIMSATLATLLKELEPEMSIAIIERMDEVAVESSDPWNNAGTGHSAFCELNYTPKNEDGTVDIKKALKIAEAFEVSRQFWSFLIEKKAIQDPHEFIHSVPHMSFVWGRENVSFLKKRFDTLTQNPLFNGMEYSDNASVLNLWMPHIMRQRNTDIPVAATKMELGTDVDFGKLTHELIRYLTHLPNVTLHLGQEVRNIEKENDNRWHIKVKNLKTGEKSILKTNFTFIGAGGASLTLLEKSDIEEAEGYGGFPISGQWLRCKNRDVIEGHEAKVYGLASVGSPPMSVPHLDTRIINGQKELLFGPYAGFSTKFLKNGSYWDLFGSLEFANIVPMLSAGIHNLGLTKYLIQQATQSQEDRFETLKEYFPSAKFEDWELIIAGQRVQVIKKDEKEGGVLEFGTEIVHSKDGSIAALLGASPGASTSVDVMIDVLERCFPSEITSEKWKNKLVEMIPSYGQNLNDDEEKCQQTRIRTSEILKLKYF